LTTAYAVTVHWGLLLLPQWRLRDSICVYFDTSRAYVDAVMATKVCRGIEASRSSKQTGLVCMETGRACVDT
jgi:hypothetical protein